MQTTEHSRTDHENLDSYSASDSSAVLDEIVFLWQLHRRAKLLNDGFQKHVQMVIKQHSNSASNLEVNNTPILSTKPEDTASSNSLSMQHHSSSSESFSKFMKPVRQPSSNMPRAGSISLSSSTSVSSSLMMFSHPVPHSKSHTPAYISKEQEMMQTFLTHSDSRASRLIQEGSQGATISCEMLCRFDSSSSCDTVEVIPAPVKSISRMQEKLYEYAKAESQWPLAAYILDPVRSSIVCSGPSQILEVLKWFLEAGCWESGSSREGLTVCKVKNKFSMPASELQGSYRDIMVFVVYTAPGSGLRVIAEIQIQDRILHDYKKKVPILISYPSI